MRNEDTIVAQATPPGRGGVGIIRISGQLVPSIMQKILKKQLPARCATLSPFYGMDEEMIDEGIGLYFPNPNSFTGEDVLELQGHGGPIIMDQLIETITKFGARIAKPGEFSLRAFLNDKIDLVQAESIADLINSVSHKAARAAMQTLKGEFSKKIRVLVEDVVSLRIFIEAAIDFPEEEIDFLAESNVHARLETLHTTIASILSQAQHGALLKEGVRLVLVGKPNVGKSTLMNALCGIEKSIVTPIPGTTRDVMSEQIIVHGIPFYLSDTAGLRETTDVIEIEGVKRAQEELSKADHLLFVVEDTKDLLLQIQAFPQLLSRVQTEKIPLTIIVNKIDLSHKKPFMDTWEDHTLIAISAKHHEGMNLLKDYLHHFYRNEHEKEGIFMARRRHLESLALARNHAKEALTQLEVHKAPEIIAEELRYVQHALSQITGEFTSEDLLDKIFSSFCIGK